MAPSGRPCSSALAHALAGRELAVVQVQGTAAALLGAGDHVVAGGRERVDRGLLDARERLAHDAAAQHDRGRRRQAGGAPRSRSAWESSDLPLRPAAPGIRPASGRPARSISASRRGRLTNESRARTCSEGVCAPPSRAISSSSP